MGELDDKETPQTDAHHETETEPRETDKMLEKKDDNTATNTTTTTTITGTTRPTTKSPSDGNKISIAPPPPPTGAATKNPEKKQEVNGEEIIKIPETDAELHPVTEQGREVKPKKIPIGGIKMPGFFTKIKPRGEGDGADGELLEKEVIDDNKINEEKPRQEEKRPCIGERIRNFFSRKKKNESINNGEPVTENDEPPPKKGLLNAIKLPIANMIPKKKTDDDVELGAGPGTKAGLASMETLDDSLKDQDTVDRASKINDEGLEKITTSEEQKLEEKTADDKANPANVSCMARIRSYRCSVDDALIALGVVVFLLMVGVIAYVVTHEGLTSPPVREGRYIDAVTSCGMVEGLKEDGSFAFRGIPYAQPPIGENRWKPAKLIDNIDKCWNGTFKAHNATEVCAQILGNGTKVGIEDCLTLDVITPHVRYDNPLPVIVLIGAESLTGGSPGILRPSARYARARDVIFVRPNFRMGPFGFLALDVLSRTTYPPTSGNYALSDIIAALKWIKLNIAHFGGDANSVTLFGHRAGATLVSALVTSRQMKDLYSKAWVSSSAAMFPGKPLHESERRNHEYLDVIQCHDAECLRNATVDEILDAIPDTWRHYSADLPSIEENTTAKHEWLVLDGHILQKHPADVWKDELGPPKLVIGVTAHESHTEKLYLKYTEWTSEIVRKYVEDSKIGALNLTEEAIQRYNATYHGLVAMISDIRTVCPLLTIARQQPSVPFYVVTQVESRTGLADVDADVQAILGRYEPHTVEQRRYVSAIQQLFYHYVSHGEMKQYDPRRRVINVGQDALSMENYPNCDFWISKDVVPRYARID